MADVLAFHYTDKMAYGAISALRDWVFKAEQPPAGHPFGAYFTSLDEHTPCLAKRLRIPKGKVAFFFCFADVGDLRPLPGGRGAFIFYSAQDYRVVEERQVRSGAVPEGG